MLVWLCSSNSLFVKCLHVLNLYMAINHITGTHQLETRAMEAKLLPREQPDTSWHNNAELLPVHYRVN